MQVILIPKSSYCCVYNVKQPTSQIAGQKPVVFAALATQPRAPKPNYNAGYIYTQHKRVSQSHWCTLGSLDPCYMYLDTTHATVIQQQQKRQKKRASTAATGNSYIEKQQHSRNDLQQNIFNSSDDLAHIYTYCVYLLYYCRNIAIYTTQVYTLYINAFYFTSRSPLVECNIFAHERENAVVLLSETLPLYSTSSSSSFFCFLAASSCFLFLFIARPARAILQFLARSGLLSRCD